MSEEKEFKRAFPVKLKKNESNEVLEFANIQSNFNDTVRYLIEKEIAENGIRNLQEHIPPVRDKSYFKKQQRSDPVGDVKAEPVKKVQEEVIHIPSCYE